MKDLLSDGLINLSELCRRTGINRQALNDAINGNVHFQQKWKKAIIAELRRFYADLAREEKKET